PAGAPETVSLVKDQAMAAAFRRAIQITLTTNRWGGSPDPKRIYLEVATKGRIPMDAAFDVLRLTSGREVHLTTLTARKTDNAGFRTQCSIKRDKVDGGVLVPIVRPSIAAAKDEPDMFEIWDGEIRFDPIKVPSLPRESP